MIETLGAHATFQNGARLINREVTDATSRLDLDPRDRGGGLRGGGGATSKPPTGPTCMPVAATETTCSGGVDDDCDGYADCLDTDCDGQPCGDGLTCSGGACRAPCPPGVSCVPELPAIQNVR